jgi:hypothetical protein
MKSFFRINEPETLTEERSIMAFQTMFSLMNKFHWIVELCAKSALVQNARDVNRGFEEGYSYLALVTFNEAMLIANIFLGTWKFWEPETQVQMSAMSSQLSYAINQLMSSIESLSYLLSTHQEPMFVEDLRELDQNIKSEFRDSLPFYVLFLIKESIYRLSTTDDAAHLVMTKISPILDFANDCNVSTLSDDDVRKLSHRRGKISKESFSKRSQRREISSSLSVLALEKLQLVLRDLDARQSALIEREKNLKSLRGKVAASLESSDCQTYKLRQTLESLISSINVELENVRLETSRNGVTPALLVFVHQLKYLDNEFTDRELDNVIFEALINWFPVCEEVLKLKAIDVLCHDFHNVFNCTRASDKLLKFQGIDILSATEDEICQVKGFRL